jgi:hypothetical protein
LPSPWRAASPVRGAAFRPAPSVHLVERRSVAFVLGGRELLAEHEEEPEVEIAPVVRGHAVMVPRASARRYGQPEVPRQPATPVRPEGRTGV